MMVRDRFGDVFQMVDVTSPPPRAPSAPGRSREMPNPGGPPARKVK